MGPSPQGSDISGLASIGCIRLRDGYGLELRGGVTSGWPALDGLDMSQRGGSIRIWTRGWGVGTSTGIRIKAGGGAVAIGPIHINGAAWNIDISGANPLTVENSFFLNHDTSTGSAGAHGNLRIAASKN